mmetsp:Transcript_25731/g.56751  ORF Transcript_25731/g.56751 Transcript_25731/m.56751 type:complete len:126 (-) Transcript_25731:1815-2192(-)
MMCLVTRPSATRAATFGLLLLLRGVPAGTTAICPGQCSQRRWGREHPRLQLRRDGRMRRMSPTLIERAMAGDPPHGDQFATDLPKWHTGQDGSDGSKTLDRKVAQVLRWPAMLPSLIVQTRLPPC